MTQIICGMKRGEILQKYGINGVYQLCNFFLRGLRHNSVNLNHLYKVQYTIFPQFIGFQILDFQETSEHGNLNAQTKQANMCCVCVYRYPDSAI